MDEFGEFWADYFRWSGLGAGRAYHGKVGRLAWRIGNRHVAVRLLEDLDRHWKWGQVARQWVDVLIIISDKMGPDLL